MVASPISRRRLARCLLLATIAANLAVGVAPAAAGTLDQSQTDVASNFSPFGFPRQVAQTFTAGITGGLDQVDVHIGQQTDPGTSCDFGSGVIAQIRTVTGGAPSNTVLAIANVPPSSVPTTPDFVSVSFAAAAPVSAGTPYALVLSAPDASCSGFMVFPYKWTGVAGDAYPGGAPWFRDPGFNGGVWTADGGMTGADHTFRTYVVPPDTLPPPPTPTAACGGKQATVIGTSAGETLTGTAGRDVIAGLGGRDTLRGLAGNDLLCGGGGPDTLTGGGGNDKLLGGAAVDRLVGGPGPDSCNGGPGSDSAQGCAAERRL